MLVLVLETPLVRMRMTVDVIPVAVLMLVLGVLVLLGGVGVSMLFSSVAVRPSGRARLLAITPLTGSTASLA